MKRLALTALVLTLPVLSACGATLPSLGQAPARAETGLPLGEVTARRAVAGQCALALWTRGAPATRIVIATDNPAVAHVNLGGRDVTLSRSDYDGEPAFGHYPEQTWTGPDGRLRLTAAFVARDGMIGGAVVEDAALVFAGSDGAEVVVPVGGLMACNG